MATAWLLVALLQAVSLVQSLKTQDVPSPVALWRLQEPTGSPRVSEGAVIALVDGNSSAPILRTEGGVLGPYAARFPGYGYSSNNNSARLYASRDSAAVVTSAIAGPKAQLTLVTWLRRTPADLAISSEAMLAGVWDEYGKARQYAIFTALGVCSSAPGYARGAAAHISPNGGPTPGQRYCTTAACDTAVLAPDAWHCIADVFNGTTITGSVNATVHSERPGAAPATLGNPFDGLDGIYSPEAHNAFGAEFALGANRVNHTIGGPPVWDNVLVGTLGGVGVWDVALTPAQVAAVCGAGRGFEQLREQAANSGWAFHLRP